MLRAAVIGCGTIGLGERERHPEIGIAGHAAAYAASPDAALVAVCDTDPSRAAAAARRWGDRATAIFADAAELLAVTRPELVSVCTPDATHPDLVAAALAAPGVRGVLAEKPLAPTAAQAARLGAEAQARGVVLAVNHTRRLHPAFAAARERIAAGEIGAPQHVAGTYVKGLRHNGTHWLDLLRLLAGDPHTVRGWDRLGEPGPDPTLDAELVLPGGVGARLAGLDTQAFTAFELELTGTRGRLRVEESGHVLRWLAAAPDARHPGHLALSETEVVRGALRDAALHAVADLARCVSTGARPACGAPEAVAAAALADAIAASAAAGGAPRHPSSSDP